MAVFLSANSFASATTGTENFFHYGFYVQQETNDLYLLGIPQGTTVLELRTQLFAQPAINNIVSITNSNNGVKNDTDIICTGDKVTLRAWETSEMRSRTFFCSCLRRC